MTDKKVVNKNLIEKNVIITFWLLFIIVCFLNRDKITIDNIVSFTPKNLPLAIGVMLLLFSIKSVSIVIYDGLLYAASGVHYSKYITGSMIGLFPAIISFSVMGMSADDISSPAFIISTAFEIGLMILSIAIYFIWRKKQKQNSGGKNAE